MRGLQLPPLASLLALYGFICFETDAFVPQHVQRSSFQSVIAPSATRLHIFGRKSKGDDAKANTSTSSAPVVTNGAGGNAVLSEPLVMADPRRAFITPDGYGFTAPMSRILAQAGRGKGYFKARASDTVIEVMDALTSKQEGSDGSTVVPPDVALVFDDDDPTRLLGLFTESDYIKVSI